MNDIGFGLAVLDRASSTGGKSGNAINGIGANNKKRGSYISAARGELLFQ